MALSQPLKHGEISSEREAPEEIETGHPWLVTLVLLLAAALYLTVDIQKRDAEHASEPVIVQSAR